MVLSSEAPESLSVSDSGSRASLSSSPESRASSAAVLDGFRVKYQL